MFVPAYYSILHGILDELEVHQPLVTDLSTLRECQNLTIAKFLSGLLFLTDPNVRSNLYW